MKREGVDAPLRTTANGAVTYYELDTTANVRRLRASGGADLGGYRYSAFGVMYPADAGTPAVAAANDQPLKWKARPFLSTVGGGVYDMRARWWSPRLGAFVQADEFGYLNPKSTLWGWPGQNPYRWADPSGREGVPQWLLDLDDAGYLYDAQNFAAGVSSAATFGLSDLAFSAAGVDNCTSSGSYALGNGLAQAGFAAASLGGLGVLILPRFHGHPRSRDTARGAFDGEKEAKNLHA